MKESLPPTDTNHPWHLTVRSQPGRDIGHGIYMTDPILVDKDHYPGAQVALWSVNKDINGELHPGIYILANFTAESLDNIDVRSSVSDTALKILVPWNNPKDMNTSKLVSPPPLVDIALQLDNAPEGITLDIANTIILRHIGYWNTHVVFEIQPISQAEAIENLRGIDMGNAFKIKHNK